MKIEFDTKKYVKDLAKSKSYFHTFLNKENIAAGILRLEPGEKDTQSPHESDEVYYIVKGDGFLSIGGKDYKISEGMSYYVAKNIEHQFHNNTKELIVVYFFSGQDS
ncbi:MAG: cupin domain-containing protein [Thaumarchaeota archaeon]|nr:cupin domain-containing protein [Nitrososphaerota archaeon]MDE1867407.1 cupin domain-containing protein [Nitrososphaerota archaeon]